MFVFLFDFLGFSYCFICFTQFFFDVFAAPPSVHLVDPSNPLALSSDLIRQIVKLFSVQQAVTEGGTIWVFMNRTANANGENWVGKDTHNCVLRFVHASYSQLTIVGHVQFPCEDLLEWNKRCVECKERERKSERVRPPNHAINGNIYSEIKSLSIMFPHVVSRTNEGWKGFPFFHPEFSLWKRKLCVCAETPKIRSRSRVNLNDNRARTTDGM